MPSTSLRIDKYCAPTEGVGLLSTNPSQDEMAAATADEKERVNIKFMQIE